MRISVVYLCFLFSMILIPFVVQDTFAESVIKEHRKAQEKVCGLDSISYKTENLSVESICHTPYVVEVYFSPDRNSIGTFTVDVPEGFLEPELSSCKMGFPSSVYPLTYPPTEGYKADWIEEYDYTFTKNKKDVTVKIEPHVESLEISIGYIPPHIHIVDNCINDPLGKLNGYTKNWTESKTYDEISDDLIRAWHHMLTGLIHMNAISHATCNECGFEKTISSIPEWYFLETAKWWDEQKISDEEFVAGVEYLMSKDIIKFEN